MAGMSCCPVVTTNGRSPRTVRGRTARARVVTRSLRWLPGSVLDTLLLWISGLLTVTGWTVDNVGKTDTVVTRWW